MTKETNKWPARLFFIALFTLCIALMVLGCNKKASDKNAPCTDIGAEVDCTSTDGYPGTQVCLPDGSYSDCQYEIPKAGQPCSNPGEEYVCACSGKPSGALYCLNSGKYSACYCNTGSTSAVTAGTGGGGTSGATSSGSCPEPFSCLNEELQGMNNNLCIDASGIPPTCEKQNDCVEKGLPLGQCLDVGMGQKICLQSCEL
jgi:hypothetical protein